MWSFLPLLFILWIHGTTGVVAPVLSAQTAQADGVDYALLSVSTDTGSGTLYYDVSTTCGASPTATQVKAGTVGSGDVHSSQSVVAVGAQSANPSGLSAVTAYCAYFVQTTSVDSNVVATTTFSTAGTLTFSTTQSPAFSGQSGFTAVLTLVQNNLSACLAPSVSITIPNNVDYTSSGGLAETFANTVTPSYTGQIRPALVAMGNKNSVQHTLYDNPPANDPTGLGNTYVFSCGQMRAMGLTCITNPDYIVQVNSGAAPFDATSVGNCAGVNWCLQSVLLHEITEGLGRYWGQQKSFGKAGLAEFSAYSAPGTRTTDGTLTHYPSIDSGSTSLITPFNYDTTGGNDLGDWSASGTDAMTGFYSGKLNATLTIADIKEMTKMGYGLTHTCRIAASL